MGGRFEHRLAIAIEAVVAGHPHIDGHDALAEQAVGEVADQVGLGLAGPEVAAGRLDGQGQRSAQLAHPLALDPGQLGSDQAELRGEVGPGAAAGPAVGGDPLVVAEFGQHAGRVLVPGALLELEAEPGQLFLEHAGALDVVAEDRPAVAVDEQDDGAKVAADAALAEVAARGEPGERVGPAENEGVEAVLVEEPRDAAVLLLHIVATRGQDRVEVVGGGVGEDRQRVGVGPVGGGEEDAIGEREALPIVMYR